MIVGLCRLTLLVPESHSLKDKRMVLRSIKDRTRRKFNVAIAEVGGGRYDGARTLFGLGIELER